MYAHAAPAVCGEVEYGGVGKRLTGANGNREQGTGNREQGTAGCDGPEPCGGSSVFAACAGGPPPSTSGWRPASHQTVRSGSVVVVVLHVDPVLAVGVRRIGGAVVAVVQARRTVHRNHER